METERVVCEAEFGRYRVGVLQSGACRGILIVLTWNSKHSRENELNAHTLRDEELRTALFWIVTQGVVVSCVMTQKSAVWTTSWQKCEFTHRWGIVCVF